MKSILAFTVALILVLGMQSVAQSETSTFYFTGTITRSEIPTNIYPSLPRISVGDTFEGYLTYTYYTSSGVQNWTGPSWYLLDPTKVWVDYSVICNGFTFTNLMPYTGRLYGILVGNNLTTNGGTSDALGIYDNHGVWSNKKYGIVGISEGYIEFDDYTAQAFSDNSLPSTLTSALFDSGYFSTALWGWGGDYNLAPSIAGNINMITHVPEPVSIDIEPWFKPNIIDWKFKWAPIPVAILSTPDFDAPKIIDRTSLTFGHQGDEKSSAFCSPLSIDVNADKSRDLICFFYTGETGFQCGDTQGILRGKTKDGILIEGSDLVKIIPCR
jgi:hypothetical protein